MTLQDDYNQYYTVFGGSYHDYKAMRTFWKVAGVITLVTFMAGIVVFARG